MKNKFSYKIIFAPSRSHRMKKLIGDTIVVPPIDLNKYFFSKQSLIRSQQTFYSKNYNPYLRSNYSHCYRYSVSSYNNYSQLTNITENTYNIDNKSVKYNKNKNETIINNKHCFSSGKSLNKPKINKQLIDDNSSNKEKIINLSQFQTIQKNYQYYIKTDQSSVIKLPEPNYGTDDEDLKLLVDTINEIPTKELGYTNDINKPDIKVYQRIKEGEDVVLIRSIINVPYNKDILYKALVDIDIRKKWDKAFSDFKIVEDKGEEGDTIIYFMIKSPVFFVDDREFLQKRKIWKNFPNNNSHLLHFKSVDSPLCPPNNKIVRAKTILSGYYIVDDPNNPNNCILYTANINDLGGGIPVGILSKFSASNSKDWGKNAIKGCKMIAGK